MNSLTPEVRINKHGVPVVKHVKTSSASSGSLPAPPLPAAPAEATTSILPAPVDRKKAEFIAIALSFRDPKGRPDTTYKLRYVNETGLGILKRMISTVPEHSKVIRSFVLTTSALFPLENEMTNALLVLEHALTTDRTDLDVLLSDDNFPDLGPAVFGLRVHELVQGKTTTTIDTEEQLASDAAVAIFVAKYGQSLDTGEDDHPVLDYPKVTRIGKWDIALPTIRNPHLDTLLREQIEDHACIFEFLSERGYSAADTGPVDGIRDYLNTVKDNPALREGWL
jgi:hypothetical protein